MRLFSARIGIWLAVLLCLNRDAVAMSTRRRGELRTRVQEMFKHGYNGYMIYAYPADELKSVSCKPSYRDPDPANFGLNDIHPNASLTLLDVLSSLSLIHPAAYPDALHKVCTAISFDQDVKVQVFEMTIRALGSLLSTYQYLDQLPDDPEQQAAAISGMGRKRVDLKMYRGRILEMALDLGNRMMPAFATTTGLPYARVNLRYGIENGETTDTCAAGAGSLILEFAVLSRLTGDPRFEQAAHKAYMTIWNKRSEHDLIGNGIGVNHGQWLQPGYSGVGAGIDSFYEYGMKAAILLGDDEYLDVFQDSYAAVQTHIRTDDGFIYRPVQYRLLHQAAGSTIDSLAAFFPGLQVLAGDIESAIKGHMVYWNLWRQHSAIPETWVWGEKRIEWAGYPGRPEFVESNYYLYRATKDDFYLRVGERILSDLDKRLRTKCGFATLRNVETGEKEDRMESFVLSETLKYLYLLFDESSAVSSLSNAIFTTEGHSLSLPLDQQSTPSSIRRALRRGEDQRCPAYVQPTLNGLTVGIEQRQDWEYARELILGSSGDSAVVASDEKHWDHIGRCTKPQVPKNSFDVILGPVTQEQSEAPPEDPSPSTDKVFQDQDGHWVITDVRGLKLGVRWRLDNKGYDIVRIGPHRVRTGQEIIVIDPTMEGYLPIPQRNAHEGPAEVILRFTTASQSPELIIESQSPGQVFLHAVGATATFGRSFSANPKLSSQFTIHSGPIELVYHSTSDGCEPFTLFPDDDNDDDMDSDNSSGRDGIRDVIVMLDRGGCPFLDKLVHVSRAGGKGLIVAGLSPAASQGLGTIDTDGLIRPSADEESPELLKEVESLGLVYIDWKSGDVLRDTFESYASMSSHDSGGAGGAGGSGGSGGAGGGGLSIVMVDIVSLDGQSDISQTSSYPDNNLSTSSSKAREGRVGVGEHVIWNLRIVEAP